MTLNARGGTVTQKANGYAEEAREALDFDPAPLKNKKGESSLDGVKEDYENGGEIALEVKYLSVSDRRLRDPGRNIPFINQDDVDQARKYLSDFTGGLL